MAKYHIEVGIDTPWVGVDDVFEIDLELSNDDVNAIIEGGKKQLWVDNDLETWEYIESFTPSAYKRAIALAESYSVPIWGNKMLVANGAIYNLFLPDDISAAIFDSEECSMMQKAVTEIETRSKKWFDEDAKTVKQEYKSQRWGNRLLPNTHWSNQIFYGNWSHSIDKIMSMYSIQTDLMFKHTKVELSYVRRHHLEHVELEFSIYPPMPCIKNTIEDVVRSFGYKINRKLPIGEPEYSYAIYTDGNTDCSDVAVFMSILDELIKIE